MRCGKTKHTPWQNTVRDLLTHLTKPRPWANKIASIAHNTKAYDLHFIMNRALLLKWKPEIIMIGLKIM